ncbi:DUF4145 domain-containing protein [Vibrio sp. ED002]|uniref:DUF4145 domain-containing protein n=1 Tax=Vibrio sp. ED002 TaxID=2785123 RepID=UPI00200E5511|nr:DUF4145 domain-containing protein [Vibrio sp. ED002]UQA50997.1 DUF4145 domain-containing protein [Vibrio sp. ED002]
MERKIYRALFNPEKQHNWRCPTCEQGLLRIKKDTFSFFETAESLRDRRNPEWQAEWVEYVYSCIFECQNDQCGEPVSSSGIGFLDWDIVENEYGEDKQEYSPHFKAKSFYPPLKIIKIPEGTPEDVSGSLEQSFELYFTNAGACANQVRSAVEALLTAVKVKRFKIGKSKKRTRLNLHQRIELLPKKYDAYKDMLFAVKWLGNAGSHEGTELSANDVLDAYEIMEHLLEEIYSQRSTRLQAIAKRVNRNKGPK